MLNRGFCDSSTLLCEKCLGESGDSPIFSHVVRMKLGPEHPSSPSLLLSSLELSDTQVYEPSVRALLGTASHFCEVVVLKLTLDTPRAAIAQDAGEEGGEGGGQYLSIYIYI